MNVKGYQRKTKMGEHNLPRKPPQNERIPPREEQKTSIMVLLKSGQTAQSYCLNSIDDIKAMLNYNDSSFIVIKTGSSDNYTENAEIIIPRDNIAQIIISENKEESKIVKVDSLIKLN